MTVRVADAGGLFDTQSFTIILDDVGLPTITSSPVTTATEDELYIYDVEAVDPDGGDVLTFSLDEAPAGMSIDPATAMLTWSAPVGIGTYNVTVRAELDATPARIASALGAP